MTTWTAPEAHRVREPFTGDERAMLEGWLDWHRQTLLTKAAGLTADQLKLASAEPSNLTLLGLIRHMADVERSWFRRRAAGHQIGAIYSSDDNEDGDFDDVAEADAEADYATFLAEVEAARKTAAELPLDHEFVSPRRRRISLRWVYLHMIEEYARHNGHADLLRQRIDGTTGA
ncbi:DinB family protein [Jidongwangia harbinensis]|uniref:DinB family protein n=1 Tax=Jidongwangia harbinensis TaxID=2878561 RepID=UPI001CDA4034|nr:DinB family protein [Jidongwangia harbinensis]MCA2215129.1 DinB family protein [Jidongwangia harbinensis]